jgi:hypothetical protein
MTKDEALRLALEALKNSWTEPNNEQYEIEKEAITAIKEALMSVPDGAQPEQEPVAIADGTFNHNCPVGTPLYTAPPPVAEPHKRKPLTEQEIGAILEDINAFGTRLYTFARAIEAAHGIKGEA